MYQVQGNKPLISDCSHVFFPSCVPIFFLCVYVSLRQVPIAIISPTNSKPVHVITVQDDTKDSDRPAQFTTRIPQNYSIQIGIRIHVS